MQTRSSAVGLQQDRVLERAQRGRVVAGALRGDPQALGGGEAHDRGDFLGAARVDDRRRPLVDGEVEAGAGGVVAGVAGDVDVAADEGAQDGGGAADGGVDGVHLVLLGSEVVDDVSFRREPTPHIGANPKPHPPNFLPGDP